MYVYNANVIIHDYIIMYSIRLKPSQNLYGTIYCNYDYHLIIESLYRYYCIEWE